MVATVEQIEKMSLAEIQARLLQVDIDLDAAKDIEDWGTAGILFSEKELLVKRKAAIFKAGYSGQAVPSRGPSIEDWIS